MAGSARDPLYWDDAYPIALVLRAAHPNADPISVDLRVLYEWVVGLESFADDPALSNSEWLERIQAEWIEL